LRRPDPAAAGPGAGGVADGAGWGPAAAGLVGASAGSAAAGLVGASAGPAAAGVVGASAGSAAEGGGGGGGGGADGAGNPARSFSSLYFAFVRSAIRLCVSFSRSAVLSARVGGGGTLARLG